MYKKENKQERGAVSTSLATGIIALIFLVVGYQAAMFIGKASVAGKALKMAVPDTVFVVDGEMAREIILSELGPDAMSEIRDEPPRERKIIHHSNQSEKARELEAYARYKTMEITAGSSVDGSVRRNTGSTKRTFECFRFDPNTVTQEELVRLGFSPKQAQSIVNYRNKGGRYRRKEDFAKSFVVSDSVYARLEPYIDIPLLDLNLADSAALDALPGIGGYFAMQIIKFRESLGGFSCKEQLMDIYNFDSEKYDALKDLVMVSRSRASPFALWTLPEDSLALHPFISNINTAHSIVLFRQNNPKSSWTLESLRTSGVLTAEQAEGLSRCLISQTF